ncbi:MAG: cobalt ECF transporter T component CbiQ [Lachnospiraceae bacterium]|nr:cobalt ECF transporter T component CbiQ [Lachnospiraceae bacterium]
MSQNIEQSIRDLREMDALSSGVSPIHTVSAGAKLLVTVVYILTVVSFDKYRVSGLLFMIFYPAVLFAVSGIPVSTCLYKLRFVLPLVLAVGIFNPILDRQPAFSIGSITVTAGMISMLTLMMKGVFSLMASFLLVATTRIEALCGALRKIHVPSVLVTLLLLTYRYAAVLAEEANVMTQAYSLRAPGQKGIHYSAWGSFLGQLLLRSMDRAEELYSSMLLRGYHGEFYYAQGRKSSASDFLYAALWCALFVAARCLNLTQILGSAVVR